MLPYQKGLECSDRRPNSIDKKLQMGQRHPLDGKVPPIQLELKFQFTNRKQARVKVKATINSVIAFQRMVGWGLFLFLSIPVRCSS